jgi:hypothetical protein
MWKSVGLLILICIAVIFVAGCTTSGNSTTITPVTAPVPPATAPTVAPTPQATAIITTPVAVVATTPAAPTTDPILHRWIRQYGDPTAYQSTGYEFKFYPDGTVDYRNGTTKEVSSNIIIDTSYPYIEESGTWSALGNMTYLVKILPTGQSGAQFIRQYTLVPAHQDPDFPGVTIPAHIESSYETNEIGANTNEPPNSDLMYYPEQAKID